MYKNESYLTYEAPIGKVYLTSDGKHLTALKFSAPDSPPDTDSPDADSPGTNTSGTDPTDAVIEMAVKQLDEYFAGKRREFDLPISPHGTEFQRRVWQSLLTIPYGETRSYGQVAQMIGNPKACRAVGMANNRNPISIIIPCHRVIGSGGELTGYGGGLEAKQKLLELEKDPPMRSL